MMKSILPYFGFAVMVVDTCLMFYTIATLPLYMDLGFAVLYAVHCLLSNTITILVDNYIEHKVFEEQRKQMRKNRIRLV